MKATDLKIGDTIIHRNEKGTITDTVTVRQLGLCPSTRNAVPKVHVNRDQCYDTLQHLEVIDNESKVTREKQNARRVS